MGDEAGQGVSLSERLCLLHDSFWIFLGSRNALMNFKLRGQMCMLESSLCKTQC